MEQEEMTELTGDDGAIDDSTVEITPAVELPEDISNVSPVKLAIATKKSGTKGGRPRNDGVVAGDSAPPKEYPIPKPKFLTFKEDTTNSAQMPNGGLRWWRELPAHFRERISGYVYRDWPVLLPVKDQCSCMHMQDAHNTRDGCIVCDCKKYQQKEYGYIDLLTEPLTDTTDILNRYGTGRYRVILNGGPNVGKLCTIIVTRLPSDLRQFPPVDRRVSDLQQVDMNHPDNKSYIEFLRMAGKLTDTVKAAEEENESMAVVDAVRELGSQNKDLTDRLFKMAEKVSTPAPVAPEGMPTQFTMFMDMMRQQNTELREELREMKRSQSQAPVAPPVDPLTQALAIVKLMNESKGEGSSTTAELLRQQSENSQKQIDKLTELVQTKNSTPTPQTDIASVIESAKKLMQFKEDFVGSDTGSAASGPPSWLPYAAPVAQQALGALTAFFASRGVAVPAIANPAPVPNGNVITMQPQAQIPAVQMPEPPEGMDQELNDLLSSIALPLGNALQDAEYTGQQFHEWFIEGLGSDTYDALFAVQNGVPTLSPEFVIQTLQSHHKTAKAVMSVDPARAKQFIVEFLGPLPEGEAEGEDGELLPANESLATTP